jgi:mevalonate kinase
MLSYILMIGTGTVYKISTPKTDKVYIGSTTQKLNARMRQHRCSKACMSQQLLELGECKIEALEVLYNITKKELEIKEQYYQNLLKELTVNKKRAHQTKEDLKQQKKEDRQRWRAANPEKVAELNKKFYNRRKQAKEAEEA